MVTDHPSAASGEVGRPHQWHGCPVQEPKRSPLSGAPGNVLAEPIASNGDGNMWGSQEIMMVNNG